MSVYPDNLYLGEFAPLKLLLLRLLARLGLRLGLRGVCVPGAGGVSMGAGIPAASSLARSVDNSLARRFMTASDSDSSSCSIRILSARNWSMCFKRLFVIC
jgi:hypothetical protein